MLRITQDRRPLPNSRKVYNAVARACINANYDSVAEAQDGDVYSQVAELKSKYGFTSCTDEQIDKCLKQYFA